MKIVCDCGEVTELVDSEDGKSYTEGEGWYKTTKGSMELVGSHDQVYFHCTKCGLENWMFT